jgi:hypothetical protein
VRGEESFLCGQRAPTLFIGAKASHCTPTATEAGIGSQASAFAPVIGGGRSGQTAGQRRARRSVSAGASRGGEGRPWRIFNSEVNSRVTCDGYTTRKLTVSSSRQEEHIRKNLAQASNDPEFAPFSILRIGGL